MLSSKGKEGVVKSVPFAHSTSGSFLSEVSADVVAAGLLSSPLLLLSCFLFRVYTMTAARAGSSRVQASVRCTLSPCRLQGARKLSCPLLCAPVSGALPAGECADVVQALDLCSALNHQSKAISKVPVLGFVGASEADPSPCAQHWYFRGPRSEGREYCCLLGLRICFSR